MRASLRTIPADSFASDSTVITLDQIRPGPRRSNEYVDSPRAVATPPIKPHHLSSHPHSLIHGGVGTGGGVSPGFAHRVLPPTRASSVTGGRVSTGGNGEESLRSALPPSSIVSQQPGSKLFPLKNDIDSQDNGVVHDGESRINGDHVFGAVGTNHSTGAGGGIMCEKCHKCQCNDCTDTKPLPSHWCCGNSCEVSPEKALDFCTCFCCMKFAMYHCGNEEDYENPCGCCSTSHCMRRWTLMTVMAVCLPCLLAYLPGRGCLAAFTSVYNRWWRGRKGCNCQCNIVNIDSDTKNSVLSRGSSGGGSGGLSGGGGGTSKNSQSRRLLIESDSSSTST